MSLNDTIARIARIVVGSKQQPQGLYTPALPRIEPPPPLTVPVFHGGGPFSGGRPSDAFLLSQKTGAQQLPGHYWTQSRPSAVRYAEVGGANQWLAQANGDRNEALRLFNQYADAKGLGPKTRNAVHDSIMSPDKPRLYGADLQVDPARLMRYDEPVRTQPEAVRQALERMGAVRGPGDLERTAGDVYRTLGEEQGPLKTATRLGAEGVPHLTYRDPGHRALGVESAPNYVIPPGWVDKVLSDPRAYGVAGGGVAMGALAAPEPAQAARMPATQPMGAVASPLRVAAPPPDIGLAEPPAARGRMPMGMTGMTNRNTLMNPDDPIAQVAGNAAQRYTDYVNTAGNLLWGTDPRFVVKPQKPGEWSEYDEENALRTAHELTRRAEVTAMDAMTGGFPKAMAAARSGDQFLGAGGGRIVIPQRQEGLGGGMGSVADLTPKAKAPEPGSQAWRDAPNPNAPFPQYATQYPPVGPPVMMPKDKPSFPGETYPAKQWTPEASDFMKERARITKQVENEGYHPYFDPELRYDANPADFPQTVDTTQLVPKKLDTIAKHFAKVGAPEVRQRMQDAYAKGIALGDQGPGLRSTTKDWYPMGQLADEVGPQAFRQNFSLPMAATTGGMNPEANLLAASYMNYLRAHGEPWPEANQWPVPVGARYGDQLAGTAQDFGASGPSLTHPKRTNFAGNFEGHTSHPTLDEQMSQLMQGKTQPDWYGINEHILGQEAAKLGVDPRGAQDVMWAGQKGEAGSPMISTLNKRVEVTHRLTGMPRSEIVDRAWGDPPAGVAEKDWRIPVYSIPGMMAGGAGAYTMGGLARQNELPPLEVLEQ